MAVDPALLSLTKPIEDFTPWPRPKCPNCDTGHVNFAQPTQVESEKSEARHSHPDFEPDWISGTFSIVGQCDNPQCQQNVHGSGDYQVAYTVDSFPPDTHEFHGERYVAFFSLAHLHPPLLLMSIPESAPTQIREGILRASRCWFVDSGLTGTALRATIERFLTTEGISPLDPRGNFSNAHNRIEQWKAQEPQVRGSIADLLLAVKWLGNAGSHEDAQLSREDIYEGARLLDYAFHQLFLGPDLNARAQAINAAKGSNKK